MTSVTLRKTLKKDWDLILKLRNSDEFRTYFYNQDTISKKEHYDYLTKQKNNSNFRSWIICYGNKDVGYIRILDVDVSIIIDKKYHDKGIGTKTLFLVEKEAKKLGIKKLVGKIMIHNKNSKKIFVGNDYKLKMWWYEKNIT